MTTKQAVIELLDKLPEDCTEGKKLRQEDVMRELRKKWQRGPLGVIRVSL